MVHGIPKPNPHRVLHFSNVQWCRLNYLLSLPHLLHSFLTLLPRSLSLPPTSPSPPPSLPSVALPEADATNKTQLCHPCQRYPRQWLGWGASRLRAQEENGWEVILHNHVAGEVRAVGLSNGRATIHQHTTTPRPNWIQHKLHGAIHGSFVPPLQKKKSPNAKNTPPS